MVWRSWEQSRKSKQKIEADQGNNMTMADSYKPLNLIKKGCILDVATLFDFRVSQISNMNPTYK